MILTKNEFFDWPDGCMGILTSGTRGQMEDARGV